MGPGWVLLPGGLGKGAHQGLAVAAGDRAQGVALVEVVYPKPMRPPSIELERRK